MDLEVLNQITSIRSEIKDLRNRLRKIEDNQKIVIDSVKGSSTTFPYTQHNCIIEGLEYPKHKKTKNKYKKQIQRKEYKLEKLINKLEYELNYIEDKDSDIRMIIRYKYEDNMTWIQIQHKMNEKFPNKEYTADGIRVSLKRFLEKK